MFVKFKKNLKSFDKITMKTKKDDSSFSLYFVELVNAVQEFLSVDSIGNSN